MGKPETCKCRYSHCLHDDRTLLKSEAVRVGNQYYHKDCYEEIKTIREIVDYFAKECNPDVVLPALRKAINNIVHPKDKPGISPERLLFQVKHFCTHGHMIRHPGGLYYAIQDRASYEAYEEYKAKQRVGNYDFNTVEEDLDLSQSRKVRIKKQKSFEDILGG